MKENARQGFFNGSRTPFGFKTEELDLAAAKGKKKRLVIDETEAPLVHGRVRALVEAAPPTAAAWAQRAMAARPDSTVATIWAVTSGG